ncbi:hypothetical protein EOL70_14045 [Leucothrix sargassi]|nr:hypothetical protein EOL70_14045 [Leucothrix sargassi]
MTWLAGFIYGIINVASYWEYEFSPPNIDEMLSNRLQTDVLKSSIESAIVAEEYDEARSLVALGQQYNHPLDYAQYLLLIEQGDTASSRLVKNVSGFTEGFLSGSSDTAAGIAGALTSDFTVVGDVRDLSEQYSRYQQGLPVNELVATLAGVGVGLTAATVGSLGVAAPVKAGASTLKLATRTNRLTRSFRDELLAVGGRVFNLKGFLQQVKTANLSSLSRLAKQSYNPRAAKQISTIATDANAIRKNTSIADSVHLFRYVDNSTDLARVSRLSQRFGLKTRAVLRVLGKGAVRSVKTLRLTLELIFSVIGTLFSGLLFVFTIGGSSKSS